MDCLLGIDLGTSSVKSMLMDLEGKSLGIARRPYGITARRPGWAEQDPEWWWSCTVETIREVIDRSGVKPEDIRGIGLSGQMHGLVMVDRQGKPIRDAIIWADQRTGDEVEEIYGILGRERLGETTLNPLAPGFFLASLYWVKKWEPESFQKIWKVMLPKDYIRYRLTGETGTDYSDASGTLAFDCVRLCWLDGVLGELKIPVDIFPECHRSSQIAGVVAGASSETGLAAGTPVIYGGGDQPMQSVGSGIVGEGTVSANIGTASQISSPVGSPLADPKLRTQTFCHVLDSTWNIMGASLCGGITLNWFREKFMADKNFQELTALVRKTPAGSGGLVFLPYLNGERTPHLDRNARGVFFGARLDHDLGYFARSVMEGVVFTLKDSMELLTGLGIRADRVIASGGGATGEEWLQIQADIFDKPIYVADVVEQACLGAALTAGVGVGLYSSVGEACGAIVKLKEQPVCPKPENVERYRRKYEIFQELYRRNRDLFLQLE